MKRSLSILGSTGSIGVQCLELSAHLDFRVIALAAGRNVALLEQQARQHKPLMVAMADVAAAADLKLRLADTDIRVLAGEEGVCAVAACQEADTALCAIVGIAGLKPTLCAIEAGHRIALANKESLVCAGELVMKRAAERGVEIVPVDSEHSAIFQCLQGSRDRGELRRIILTASGGPFFGKTRGELAGVTAAAALRHPNWSMGAKVTIDSASLMNKGLEFMEAMALFALPPEKISVLVHPQSIIHSMVEYHDGAVLAQMGTPDMHLPIQYAITYPQRAYSPAQPLDLLQCGALSFAAPNLEDFPCLGLAMEAAKRGGTAGAALNGANEIAVAAFLEGEIGFLDIPRINEVALQRHNSASSQTIEAILEADAQARRIAAEELRHTTR